MGHGHHEPYTVPDYRIYKVETVPELVKTQQALEALGLKDPWLRNEVWRYDPKNWGTHSSRFRKFFFRGAKMGTAAFIVTMIATTAYDKLFPSEHDHGHGHSEH